MSLNDYLIAFEQQQCEHERMYLTTSTQSEKLGERYAFRKETIENLVYVIANNKNIYAVREASQTHFQAVREWYNLYNQER